VNPPGSSSDERLLQAPNWSQPGLSWLAILRLREMAEIIQLKARSRGRIGPDIEASVIGEELLQYVATSAVHDLRRLAPSEERHGVEVVRSLRHTHMAHVLRVAANLESQAVFGADEILRAGHSDEVLAAKLLKNGLRYSEVSRPDDPARTDLAARSLESIHFGPEYCGQAL
jgi:hypothetical protein